MIYCLVCMMYCIVGCQKRVSIRPPQSDHRPFPIYTSELIATRFPTFTDHFLCIITYSNTIFYVYRKWSVQTISYIYIRTHSDTNSYIYSAFPMYIITHSNTDFVAENALDARTYMYAHTHTHTHTHTLHFLYRDTRASTDVN